ncbi:MAG TPA: hypothetical protein VNA25_17510 [Phycisphaerae bacterium]|nr:hypothetical protein [Phycisphaerae bacterium]
MKSESDRLAHNARITLEVSCCLKPGETVVILTKHTDTRYTTGDKLLMYSRALADAAAEMGALPTILDVTHFLSSETYESGGAIKPIREALHSADVVIATMDQVRVNQLVGREDNDDEFLTAGTRRMSLQGNGMELWELDREKVAAIRPRTQKLIGLLRSAKTVRVTSPAGTDFTFGMGEGSKALPILGIVPLYGEVATTGRQGSENGTIVVDGSTQMRVRRSDELDRPPLRIEVADGRVTDYTGDAEQVERLRAFISSGDPPADAIDEIGIPTTRIPENDKYWWSDGTHQCHTVHIALGNNLRRATHVHGPRHMDGEVINPTVEIDGTLVLKNAEFTGPLALG